MRSNLGIMEHILYFYFISFIENACHHVHDVHVQEGRLLLCIVSLADCAWPSSTGLRWQLPGQSLVS
jgi:hypothetical protein